MTVILWWISMAHATNFSQSTQFQHLELCSNASQSTPTILPHAMYVRFHPYESRCSRPMHTTLWSCWTEEGKGHTVAVQYSMLRQLHSTVIHVLSATHPHPTLKYVSWSWVLRCALTHLSATHSLLTPSWRMGENAVQVPCFTCQNWTG